MTDDPDEHGLTHAPSCDRPPPHVKLSTLARHLLTTCPTCRARALNHHSKENHR